MEHSHVGIVTLLVKFEPQSWIGGQSQFVNTELFTKFLPKIANLRKAPLQDCPGIGCTLKSETQIGQANPFLLGGKFKLFQSFALIIEPFDLRGFHLRWVVDINQKQKNINIIWAILTPYAAIGLGDCICYKGSLPAVFGKPKATTKPK